MSTLNYCRQMVKQFTKTLEIPSISTEYRLVLSHAIDLAGASQKFMLPAGGRLHDDKELRALDESEELRLPYPMIALEYEFPPGANNETMQDGELSCPKRIAFARERADHIVITPVVWSQAEGMWVYMFECSIPKKNYLDRSISVGGRVAVLASRECEEIPISDYEDEIGVLLCFLNALQCSNVKSECIYPPKQPKKSKGALQFDSYHILTISGASPSQTTCASGAHRSPREHLRRGHIRRYESGLKIWVNAHVVSAGAGGKVHKDYRVTL